MAALPLDWGTLPYTPAQRAAIEAAHNGSARQAQADETTRLRAEVAALRQELEQLRSQLLKSVQQTGRNFAETRTFLFGRAGAPEDELPPLDELIAGAIADVIPRIDALEAKPTLRYRNVYSDDEQYGVGDFVSHQGSVWHCNRTAYGEKPNGGSDAWTLSVKAGRPGKDMTSKEPVVR